ncbi:hypothetical protein TNCV_3744651 [Trichonephila clavipes]|nr:hypothetical protein TNCV_3744651 [Trichonephila clavipes]
MLKRLRLDIFELLETKLPVRLINTTNEWKLVKGHGDFDFLLYTLCFDNIAYHAGWVTWLVYCCPSAPKVAAMSVDFHDAENRQWPCRMIMWRVKDPYNVYVAWVLLAKLNPCTGLHRQSSGAFL